MHTHNKHPVAARVLTSTVCLILLVLLVFPIVLLLDIAYIIMLMLRGIAYILEYLFKGN